MDWTSRGPELPAPSSGAAAVGSADVAEALDLELLDPAATAASSTAADVLVAGGDAGGAPTAAVARLRLRSGCWDALSSLGMARYGHCAVGLQDGRVLVLGGVGSDKELLASVDQG